MRIWDSSILGLAYQEVNFGCFLSFTFWIFLKTKTKKLKFSFFALLENYLGYFKKFNPKLKFSFKNLR